MTWWWHHFIFAWPISENGRLIPSHTWKSNIQAVYPFSTRKNERLRWIFLSFHVFEKTKNENGAISVFNIKSKNEWTQHTRTQRLEIWRSPHPTCFLNYFIEFLYRGSRNKCPNPLSPSMCVSLRWAGLRKREVVEEEHTLVGWEFLIGLITCYAHTRTMRARGKAAPDRTYPKIMPRLDATSNLMQVIKGMFP